MLSKKSHIINLIDAKKTSIFLPAILIPACVSSSPAFLMMYSAGKLNKQSDNMLTWCCCCCPIIQSRPTLCDPMTCSMPGLSVPYPTSWSLPKFMSIASVMPSISLILWYPLLLLPSIFAGIRDFPNELAVHIRSPKYWSFSFSISPSTEYSGLISVNID